MPNLRYLMDNLQKIPLWLRSRREVRFHLNRALWETGLPWTALPPERLNDIFPGVDDMLEPVQVIHPFVRLRGTSVEVEEIIVMASIVKFRQARNVLEIGTFDGNTAMNFAANISHQGEVTTVDLPPGGVNNQSGKTGSVRKPAHFSKRQYLQHSLSKRIRQIYGDSAEIDWQELPGPYDVIFIDGDHSSSYVRSDTLNALTVLTPGGVIIWHDYDWPSVATVLNRFAKYGAPIRWIQGTRLAVAVVLDPDGLKTTLATTPQASE